MLRLLVLCCLFRYLMCICVKVCFGLRLVAMLARLVLFCVWFCYETVGFTLWLRVLMSIRVVCFDLAVFLWFCWRDLMGWC